MSDLRPPTTRLVEIERLSVGYGSETVVSSVSLAVDGGEVVGMIGESGSGKSTVALGLLGLLPSEARWHADRFEVCGHDVGEGGEAAFRKLRGDRVSIIFQEPMTALNPTMRVGKQITEALRLHRPELAGDAIAREAERLLGMVHIPDPQGRARSFPHELSGGMRQRVMIAMALASRPDLLIADEPTTALDVTVQAQILALLKELQADFDFGVLLITHNIAVVADICDRVVVMYTGEVVEEGPVEEVLLRPLHPYTIDLLCAVPRLDVARGPVAPIVAEPGPVGGCRYINRCSLAEPSCSDEQELESAGQSRVRCWKAAGGMAGPAVVSHE